MINPHPIVEPEESRNKALNRKIKKIFALFSILLSIVMLYLLMQITLYLYEGGIKVADSIGAKPLSKEFHVNLQPIVDDKGLTLPEKILYWHAMRKFTALEDCLENGGQSQASIYAINWAAIRTQWQAEVCLHHIATALKTTDNIVEWLEKTGFSASFIQSRNFDDMQTINGNWNRTKGEKSPPFGWFSIYQVSGWINRYLNGDLSVTIIMKNCKPVLTNLEDLVNF